MLRKWCVPAFFVAICFFCQRSLLAQDWQPINPEELKMAADPEHPNDAIILYHEELSDDLKSHAYVYKRIKIFTEKGREHANVEIPYDSRRFHIIDIKARTIAPDGSITPFTGKAFDTTIVKGRGLKYAAKTFTLPNVVVGSVIEWKYTMYWESFAVKEPHWIVQDDMFQKRAKFIFVPFIKSGYYIHDEHGVLDRVYSQQIGLPANTEIKTTPDEKRELELKDIPAFEHEDFSPPPDVLKWRVNFYYGTDKMAKPAEFWKEEGKYWSKDAEKFIGHSGAVAAAANQAAAGASSPEEKVHKIYSRVQKMKNLTYAIEEGSMGEFLSRMSKEKRTIDDVLSTERGYRDELVRLFVAMVRSVGVSAYLMRIADRDETFFQPKIPNPYQLTSEIAIVNLGGKDIFVDPGTPMCPFGLLAWQHSGTEGLRQLPGGGADLAKTEPPTYKDAISKRVARVTLADDGSLRGTVIVIWARGEALVQRLGGVRTDDSGRKKEMENEVREMLPNGSRVDFVSATGWEDPEAQLSATFKVEVPSFASNAGKRMLVPTGLFETNNRQPFTHGERKHPVYFNYPYYTIDDVQIVFPSRLRVENLPETQPVKTDYALYQCKRELKGNALSFSRTFAMGGIAFPREEYDGLRKFFAGVTSGDTEQVVLTATQ
jgi:hypothetical protein